MSTSARDFVLEVIENYKSHPCLWQVIHPDYHNREKKNAAMNALLDLFKAQDPSANLDTVKKKITSMRNCFRKEFNKVKASSRSGAGTAGIHVPKLWYYSKMLFLADVDIPRSSSSLDSSLDDLPFEDNAEISNYNYESEDSISTNVQSPLSQISVASSSRRRKTKAQANIIIAKVAKKMGERILPPAKLQYDSFGEHIAERLRNLPSTMAIYCQKIINDSIFMAETNNLTIDSHIVNNSQVSISQPNLNSRSLKGPRHSQITQNARDHMYSK